MDFIERAQVFSIGAFAGVLFCAAFVICLGEKSSSPEQQLEESVEDRSLCFVEVHNVGTSKVALVNPNELGPFDLEKSEYITIEPGAGIRLPVLVGEPTKLSKLPVACMGLLP